MPAKKQQITDAERAKRIREAAKELETSNDSAAFDQALGKVLERKAGAKKSSQKADSRLRRR
jgi:predicted nuclease of restriction endonuclease-like RecB superfamily